MAFRVCPACGRENSPNARWCVSCKTPFEAGNMAAPLDARFVPTGQPADNPGDQRSVGLGLFLGIALMPYIFAWLTLRRGHSMLARALSFLWLAAILVSAAVGNSGKASRDASAAAAGQAAIRTDWAKGIKAGCLKTNASSMGGYADKVCQCTVDRVMAEFSDQELAAWAEHVEKYGSGPMQSKERYKGFLYQCVFTHHPRGNEFFVEDGKR